MAFDYGCGKGQACFSIPMIARDILSLPGSAGHEEVEDGVTSISMEQDYSVFKAATNVAVSLLENSLIDGRDWPSFTRIAVAFQNSFCLVCVPGLGNVAAQKGFDRVCGRDILPSIF